MPRVPARQSRPRLGPTVLLVLSLPLLPCGAYSVHKRILSCVSRTISSSAGMRVTIGGIRGSFAPAIVIEDLRVGNGSPMLTVREVKVGLGIRSTTDRIVREVRLVRPELRLTSQQVARLWPRSTTPGAKKVIQRTTRRLKLSRLSIQDGAVKLQASHGAHTLAIESRGIFLRPERRYTRLILGKTNLHLDGKHVLELASVAADLDLARTPQLIRLACLGGQLREMETNLHLATIERRLDGYQLKLQGSPVGRSTGWFAATCHLDRAGRPVGPHAVRLKLHQTDLSAFDPLLDPLGLKVLNSRISGEIQLSRQHGELLLHGQLRASDLTVAHPLVAARPVGPFDGEVEGFVVIDPSAGTLEIQSLKATRGAVELRSSGQIQTTSDKTLVSLDIDLPKTACHKVLTSLPEGFAPTLRGMALAGEMGMRASLKLDSSNLDGTEVDVSFVPLGCRVLADPPTADIRSLKREFSVTVSGPRGTGMRWTLGSSNPDYHPLSKISRHLKAAFIVAEDGRFYQHDGFDSRLLRLAFVSNLKENRILRGASTISQQLVKNVFLSHQRTFARKFQEAVLTWRLEQVVDKQRILELYLNLVELGPSIYGVAQASRHYFGTSPRNLSPLQAAHLAALTPSPRYLSNQFRERKPGLAWTQKLQMLLRMMRRRGTLSRKEQHRWSTASLTLLNH